MIPPHLVLSPEVLQTEAKAAAVDYLRALGASTQALLPVRGKWLRRCIAGLVLLVGPAALLCQRVILPIGPDRYVVGWQAVGDYVIPQRRALPPLWKRELWIGNVRLYAYRARTDRDLLRLPIHHK